MRRQGGKLSRGCLISVAVLAVALGIAGAVFGPVVAAFARQGFFDRLPDKVEYNASREANLKALYTAMMLYHDSEERFPEGAGWMDAIEARLNTNDLKKGEAAKKLRRPGLADGYGYGLNQAASGKYKDDVPGKPAETALIYESKRTDRNVSGDPKQDLDGLAISVSGQLIPAKRP